VREGTVFATAKAIHLGRSTQVWEIKTSSEENTLINISRMTLAVVDKK
jgi:1,4-dihydroxy-2-naphthoyl-CoA hydrolase